MKHRINQFREKATWRCKDTMKPAQLWEAKVGPDVKGFIKQWVVKRGERSNFVAQLPYIIVNPEQELKVSTPIIVECFSAVVELENGQDYLINFNLVTQYSTE